MNPDDISRYGSTIGGVRLDKLREQPNPDGIQGDQSAEIPFQEVHEGKDVMPEEMATRAGARLPEGIGKSKLVLLGGGLTLAILFFVFTALVGKPSKKALSAKPASEQTKEGAPAHSKGSVTPVMEPVHAQAPDNSSGQLGPNDIRRTRSNDQGSPVNVKSNPVQSAAASKQNQAGSLGSVPSFADTQQHWQEPTPYGAAPASGTTPTPVIETHELNALKGPSLIFVRSLAQNSAGANTKVYASVDVSPLLQITPGTRVQAKLQTQISSAVQAPVVAVVEYTYAIGDRVVVPAGARVYGQLQQADRSGLVSVKFDEIELIDGKREKIDAIGAGLDLGPIKGDVYGKNIGKNFMIRAVSGIGSVLTQIAGNNSSAALSEDDLIRERLAQNIGTAGDSEIMKLNADSRIVVSVPADTKIYVIFTKHVLGGAEVHRVASETQ